MERALKSNQDVNQSELDKNLKVLGREVEDSLNKKLFVLEQLYGVLLNAKIIFEIKQSIKETIDGH